MPTVVRPRPPARIQTSALLAVLGGAALGAALGANVLVVLDFVTLDACVREPSLPLVFSATLVAMGAVGVAALVRVADPRPAGPWTAAGLALALAAAGHVAYTQHREDARSDCTWIVNPPVPGR